MPTDDDTTTSTTDDATQTASPDADNGTSGSDDGSSTPSSDGDAGTTPTADSSATATSSDDSSGIAAGSDGDGGTTTSADSSGTASSDGDGGTTTSSDSSATATSSDSSGGATAGSDGGSGQAQTPAAQLQVDPVQPVSLDPSPSLTAASSTGTDSTDSSTSDATATAEEAPEGGEAPAGGSKGPSVSDIIAVGTLAAKIMAASAPNYSMRNAPASVLPKDADPLSLTGVLPDPQEMRVPLNYRNDMPSGADLIFNLPIVVQWRCGGSYKGTGRYITGASMFLDSGTDTGAFYKVDVDASFANAFTSASSAGPVAGIDLLVSIKVTDTISPNGLVVVLNGTIHGDGSGKISVRP